MLVVVVVPAPEVVLSTVVLVVVTTVVEVLARAEAGLVLVSHENRADEAAVKAAQDIVDQHQAVLGLAHERNTRYQPLVRLGAASQIEGVRTRQELAEAEADLASSRADLAQAREKLGLPDVRQARVRRSKAAVELARINREWTRVAAPANGYVTRFDLRVGDVVTPGQRLFPFIESDAWSVDANFKETQVAHVRPGMPARVQVDIYGSHEFNGVVESLSAGSAASFSLLPPQNTTGNWVKVTQRIPVRVRLLDIDPERPYRLGASASVTIDEDAALVPVPPADGSLAPPAPSRSTP